MRHAQADVIKPAIETYRGVLTTPERWQTWQPRQGDILVCTPPKCGTTWTQTMTAMLLNGKTDLPERVSVMSPWVDANFSAPEDVAADLTKQSGRRVVKTHTPADGFPVWNGVTVIAVYRHPLDVFFSLRKHALNMKDNPDHPMKRPISEALASFLSTSYDFEDFDRDSLATIARHYHETVQSNRLPKLELFHYADMIADQRGTVKRLADFVGVGSDDDLIDQITTATGFETMRAEAHKYAPEGGKDFWNDDKAFFDSGGSDKWRGKVSDSDMALYNARMAELVPDATQRNWLEFGNG